MGRAGKGKRKSVSKLENYAHLKRDIEALSVEFKGGESSSSKGKGKGKTASSTAKEERMIREMEAIEVWIMSKKEIAVQSVEDMEMLLEISNKCGHFGGRIKIKGGNPKVKADIRKLVKQGNLKLK